MDPVHGGGPWTPGPCFVLSHQNLSIGMCLSKPSCTRVPKTWRLCLKYGLVTKCEVKMTGYWPSSFFVCLGTETKSRSINSQKKERGQYPAILTEQTWSTKDLLYGFRGNFACRIQRVVPSGQDGSILHARVANHSARFRSSCPLTELPI